MGCSKLVIESSYNRLIAPPPLNSSKAIIRITITIHSILQVNREKIQFRSGNHRSIIQIDEIGETFYVSFNQDAAWIDPRLVYKNLKRNTDLNVLSEDETDAIWTPQIVFYNTKGKEESVADERTILSVIPGEEFKFDRTDQTTYENIYMFQGGENNLKLSKTHDTKFLCQYDMAWYPFDTQICTMDIVLNIVQVYLSLLIFKGYSPTLTTIYMTDCQKTFDLSVAGSFLQR